jgi:hypothetical protein
MPLKIEKYRMPLVNSMSPCATRCDHYVTGIGLLQPMLSDKWYRCPTMGWAHLNLSVVKNNAMDDCLHCSMYFPFTAMLQHIGPICWFTPGKSLPKW